MKYNLIIFITIISLYKGQQQFNYDQDTKTTETEEYDTTAAEHHTNFSLDMDTVNHAWEQIQQLGDGEKKFVLRNEEMGSGRIVFKSPSEKLLIVKVFVEDPYKEDTTVLGFEGKYKWVDQLERLVPTNCTPKEAPTPEKIQVQTECIQGVHLASEIIKVVAAAELRDDNNDNANDIAECIKTKTFQDVETEREKCTVTALEQGLRGIKQALELKIDSLRAQGWTCNDQGECHKTSGPEVVNTYDEVVEEERLDNASQR